ncbi:MAG: hypothetical protein GY800_07170 [Planctomycetes bacterium]|nr:hypothetical protein [Planctomycetota bacterium]
MGTVNTIESGSEVTITLDADTGDITAGGTGDAAGRVLVRDNAGLDAIKLTGDGAHMEIGAGGAGNDGRITVRDRVINKVFEFNGADAALYIGGTNKNGQIVVRDTEEKEVLKLDGNGDNPSLSIGAEGKPGKFAIKDEEGGNAFELDGKQGLLSVKHKSGKIRFLDPELDPRGRGGQTVFTFNISSGGLKIGTEGKNGGISVHDETSRSVMSMSATNGNFSLGTTGKRGQLTILDEQGKRCVFFGSLTHLFRAWFGVHDKDSELVVKDKEGTPTLSYQTKLAQLRIGASGRHGEQGKAGWVIVEDRKGKPCIDLRGDEAKLLVGSQDNPGDIYVFDGARREAAFHLEGRHANLHVGAKGNEGDIRVKDGEGREVFKIDGHSASLFLGAKGNDAHLWLRDKKGRNTILLDGDRGNIEAGTKGVNGDVFVKDKAGKKSIHLKGSTGVIYSKGGDCAEEFDIAEKDEVDPGAVLVIDDESRLTPCKAAYDKKVAGVVSGANGLNPGMVLGKNGAYDDNDNGRLPIALNGKVYCKVDAGYSPIEMGDLLTTSPTAGHAMRADDPMKAFGAVIGKALSPLKEGRGMVPILVALQ